MFVFKKEGISSSRCYFDGVPQLRCAFITFVLLAIKADEICGATWTIGSD
jgi:hypothetical protein